MADATTNSNPEDAAGATPHAEAASSGDSMTGDNDALGVSDVLAAVTRTR